MVLSNLKTERKGKEREKEKYEMGIKNDDHPLFDYGTEVVVNIKQ